MVKNFSRFHLGLAENATLLFESFWFIELHPMLTFRYKVRVEFSRQKG